MQGIGLGHLNYFNQELSQLPEQVRFLEIRPEDYFGNGRDHNLSQLKSQYDLSIHGTEMSLLSSKNHDDYLEDMAKVIQSTKAPWVSDHLSWLSSDNYQLDAYVHPVLNDEIAKNIKNKCHLIAEKLNTPFHLENVANFIDGRPNEGQFYKKIFNNEKTKMIFNINSFIITNALNKTQWLEQIKTYPLEYIESATFVPPSCGNVMIERLFQEEIVALHKDVMQFIFDHSSCQSLLIQRRYPENTYKSLEPYFETAFNLYETKGGSC